MSRTYHHGERARAITFDHHHYCGYPADEAPPKKKRFTEFGNWMRTPNWWIHEFHEVKHRAKTRNLLATIKDGTEDIVLPLVRKPHQYYW